jgi:hypothetical protein
VRLAQVLRAAKALALGESRRRLVDLVEEPLQERCSRGCRGLARIGLRVLRVSGE